MIYEVGDKVYYKNLFCIMKAEILKIDNDVDYNYYIEYEFYEGEKDRIWVSFEYLDGFQEGTEKYLIQKINELLKVYSRESILGVLEKGYDMDGLLQRV